MDRRHFLKTAALGATALSLTSLTRCAAQKQPNILFIFSDDHAYQAISAYGSNRNKTPNIDRIADEGVLFTNCCVTNSICAPSRAVIQTGKHSHLNGVRDNREIFDGTQQTFPKIMSANGYQTAMVGKWHLKSEPIGFDYWNVLPGQGHYYNPEFRTPDGLVQEEGYVTNIVTDKALNWLENDRDKEKPFLLMLQHKAPHREWLPGPDHLNMYDDVTMPEPETLFDDYSTRGTAARAQEMEIDRHMNFERDLKFFQWKNPDGNYLSKRFTPEQKEKWDAAYEPKNKAFREANLQGKELVRWKYQRYIKDYLRCIASVDDNVGRVLDYLEESGLADNTVVVYSSDQGFYLGEHGWFDKRFMYQESFKTPLLVRWPGVTQSGITSDALVSNLDFAETFLDIAGMEIPQDMQGLSFKSVLRKGKTPQDWRKSFYYHYYEYPAVHMVNRHEGVYDGRYKLMHFYQLDEWELYDLQSDPQEMQNVYSDAAYADEINRLKQELKLLKVFYKIPQENAYKSGRELNS